MRRNPDPDPGPGLDTDSTTDGRPARATAPTTPPTNRTRRRVLAAVASGATVGAAGCLAGSDGTVAVTVDTFDARGSSPGERRVPVPDAPTVIDLFATWCAPCAEQMAALRAVHREFGARAAFVSVTNERLGGGLTRADIADWWAEHDGDWTLGHDPESDLMAALGANGLPFLAVADESGEVIWSRRGPVGESALRDRVAAAVGATTSASASGSGDG